MASTSQLSNLEPAGQECEDSVLMPGFRLHPTDEELLTYYLPKHLSRKKFPEGVITELDIDKYNPSIGSFK
jgi:hypothetical protein